MTIRRARNVRLGALLAGLVLGLLACGLLVIRGSSAVFAPVSTSTTGNSWASGTVSLTDDSSGVMFNATNLLPSNSGFNCITVNYTGSVTSATVKMFASTPSDPGGVAAYYDLVIYEGTGGGFGNCTGFNPTGAAIFTDTLDKFGLKTSYTTGVGNWSPAVGTSRVYKVVYTLKPSAPSSAQNSMVQLNFLWEAQA